ncbi:MAG: YqaE/Pmp3 family membrane protein [Flavobacteriales bacterium]|nr:YqaE/Pmp3 family membrane protein [Flavobacteriales bacterium]
MFFVSCSSESDVLSSFSKRKYLKNFKEKKEKFDNKIEDRDVELASVKSVSTITIEEEATPVLKNNTKGISFVGLTPIKQKTIAREVKKELVDWNKYNRIVQDDFLASKEIQIRDYSISNNQRAAEWVLAVLAIFIPPLAVFLYEDSVTANFWVDLLLCLLFWLPGIIFAFLVIFAGVSV